MGLTFKTKLAIIAAVVFWSSAFVGIRAGLEDFSPGGLALLRYLIGSFGMWLIFIRRPKREKTFNSRELTYALLTGVVGIGMYNITLNYGEQVISSGVASFIISQSPIITTLLAIIYLKEKVSLSGIFGMVVSGVGVALITLSQTDNFNFYVGIFYILFATFVGSLYSILQKALLRKHDVIDLTTYAVWGGTLILFIFTPDLIEDLKTASLQGWITVIYLGIFPTVIGYLAWSYVLTQISTSQAVSYLYFSPLIATLIGWVWLGEIPELLAFVGGLIALFGVWWVHLSFNKRRTELKSLMTAQ